MINDLTRVEQINEIVRKKVIWVEKQKDGNKYIDGTKQIGRWL